MGVGRFFCVCLPLCLAVGAIVSFLVATLSGVVHNELYVFQVNLTNLSISPSGVVDIAKDLVSRDESILNTNITAGNLGLAQAYDVNLWGYCVTDRDGKRECTKARFDWASHELNTTWIEEFGSVAGVKIDLPTEIKDALHKFRTVTKWTQILFVAALLVLAIELCIGIFSTCSTVMSCVTWFVSSVTIVLVGAAAGVATAMATVIVGAVDSHAKAYGVDGGIGVNFLAAVWLATALAIGATTFWLFTICCCKPGERRNRSYRDSAPYDGEKLVSNNRAYAPLTNGHEMSGGYYNPNQYQQYGQGWPNGNGRPDLAYEPYSHRT